jgi:hypothetical protein
MGVVMWMVHCTLFPGHDRKNKNITTKCDSTERDMSETTPPPPPAHTKEERKIASWIFSLWNAQLNSTP